MALENGYSSGFKRIDIRHIANVDIARTRKSSHMPKLFSTIYMVSGVLLILLVSAGYSNFGLFSSAATVTSTCNTPVRPVFVWMFGYVGDSFYPLTNNSVTPSEMISEAQSISNSVGASKLRIISAVDVEPGHNIQSSMIPTIADYVANLSLYSSMVYGRIDMEQFSNYSSLSTEIGLYVNQLHLKGVFFDLGPVLYSRMGESAFNNMMQQLTNEFPNVCYLFNQSSTTIIMPESGTTWASNAYLSPTVSPGSLTSISLSKIQTLNKYYPGRVIVHYDSNAGLGKEEPMAYFADQSSSSEQTAIHTLAEEGYNYAQKNSPDRFNVLYPVFGAWTWSGSAYHGTLYNSFTFGTYDRGTVSSFTSTMKSYA